MNPQNLQRHEGNPPNSFARAEISGHTCKYSFQNATALLKTAMISDNAPQTPRSSSLLRIPPELVTHILLYLSPHDIISCGRTCRMLYDLCSCPALRYIVQMERCAVIDDMRPGLGYLERLRILKDWEEAWATLDFRRSVQISTPFKPTSIYDFTGGALLLGTGTTLDPESPDTVGYASITLPSLSDMQGEKLEWRRCSIETKILELGLAIPEHDLIAALTVYVFPVLLVCINLDFEKQRRCAPSIWGASWYLGNTVIEFLNRPASSPHQTPHHLY